MAEHRPNLREVPPKPLHRSYMDLIDDCDNFPYPDSDPQLYEQYVSTYYKLLIPPCPRPLGYLLPSVALTLKGVRGWTIDEDEQTLILNLPDQRASSNLLFSTLDDSSGLEIEDAVEDTPHTEQQQRSAIFARTTAAMYATGHFEVLKKWRDELYPIYWRPPPEPVTNNTASAGKPRPRAELLANVERSASSLFGIVTYGCHMTAYVRHESEGDGAGAGASASASLSGNAGRGGGGMSIWVPRRARTKGTYPGMMDQTVAGGIATGETAWESLVREAEEEASLPAELVRRKARAVGTVSYIHIRDARAGGETGLPQPECQFCYDLDLTGEEARPQPNDDEVEAFELLTVEQCREALAAGEFKPNCALVLLDFFVRHGYITAENDADYVEIVTRLHRRLEFPTL